MRFERVLLVNPPSDAEWRGIRPHIGLGYLAETLAANGIQYDVMDMNLKYTFRHLRRKIDEFKPDLIGLPLLTLEYQKQYQLIHDIKREYPKIKIIGGGPHVTIMKQEVLKECPSLDFGAMYEGEHTLLELCEGHLALDEIDGLIYRRGHGIYENRERERVADLDTLPWPKYEKFELSKYVPEADIYSSRGCPHECIFCPNRIISKGFRARSPKNVVDEMEYWYQKGYRQFNFDDDNFNYVRERVLAICDEIEARGMKDLFLRLSNGIRADRMDYDLLARMKEVGFHYMAFGVDAGNNEMLRIVKKGETIEQIEQAVAAACDLGYDVKLLFVVGTPYETREDVEDKVRLCRKFPVQDAHFYNIIPYPGTELFDWIKERGLFLKQPEEYLNDISCLNYTPIFETPELPELERKRTFAYLKGVQRDIHRQAAKRMFANSRLAGTIAGTFITTSLGERLFYRSFLARKVAEALRYRHATS